MPISWMGETRIPALHTLRFCHHAGMDEPIPRCTQMLHPKALRGAGLEPAFRLLFLDIYANRNRL